LAGAMSESMSCRAITVMTEPLVRELAKALYEQLEAAQVL
jgi:hypothetical protein